NLALGLILLQQGKRNDAVLHLSAAAQGADPDIGRQAQSILVQVGR
ncbi:MAG: hypothetical protein HOQ35_21635, partial [Acidobacteriaceae bacterium]|nr:hypothetical protein [Acidobacteriaceae bacterium]